MSKQHERTPKRRRLTRYLALGAALAAAALTVSPIAPAQEAQAASGDYSTQARPNFDVPFPCGQVWSGQTRTNHSPQNAIDFNRAYDYGDRVVASAAGTVTTVRNLGDTSYGRYVVISHSGHYKTYYAHLKDWTVSVGQYVRKGTTIGHVGSSGGSTGPHLHYEQRYYSSAVKVVFDGRQAYYWGTKNYKSTNNCGGNPYTPREVCGSNYDVIDQHALKADGVRYGTVYLMYNSSNKYNCVVTLKTRNVGKASWVMAYLEPQGKTRSKDAGSYKYYAGPVKRYAPSCVKWGGRAGPSATTYNSPWEHCSS